MKKTKLYKPAQTSKVKKFQFKIKTKKNKTKIDSKKITQHKKKKI